MPDKHRTPMPTMQSPTVRAALIILRDMYPRPTYGAQLAKRAEVSASLMFRVLRTLESAGLIQPVNIPLPIDCGRGRPPKYYRITKEGVTVANELEETL